MVMTRNSVHTPPPSQLRALDMFGRHASFASMPFTHRAEIGCVSWSYEHHVPAGQSVEVRQPTFTPGQGSGSFRH